VPPDLIVASLILKNMNPANIAIRTHAGMEGDHRKCVYPILSLLSHLEKHATTTGVSGIAIDQFTTFFCMRAAARQKPRHQFIGESRLAVIHVLENYDVPCLLADASCSCI